MWKFGDKSKTADVSFVCRFCKAKALQKIAVPLLLKRRQPLASRDHDACDQSSVMSWRSLNWLFSRFSIAGFFLSTWNTRVSRFGPAPMRVWV